VLIWNPYTVIKKQYESGMIDAQSYNALLARMIEIRASDLHGDPEVDGAGDTEKEPSAA
jgi:hypothetical protein